MRCTITSLDKQSLHSSSFFASLLPWPTFTNITRECDAIFFLLFDYYRLLTIDNNHQQQKTEHYELGVIIAIKQHKGCNGIEIERKRLKSLTYTHISPKAECNVGYVKRIMIEPLNVTHST